MKILADAHISLAICDFLNSCGHDCVLIERIQPGMADAEVLRLAVQQDRVILTADKDFGELIFRQKVAAKGVILIRLRTPTEAQRASLFQSHWPAIEKSVPGHFVVATNRRVKRTPLPTAEN